MVAQVRPHSLRVNECNPSRTRWGMAISRKVRVALILSLCLLLVIAAKTVIAFGRYTRAERSFAPV